MRNKKCCYCNTNIIQNDSSAEVKVCIRAKKPKTDDNPLNGIKEIEHHAYTICKDCIDHNLRYCGEDLMWKIIEIIDDEQ